MKVRSVLALAILVAIAPAQRGLLAQATPPATAEKPDYVKQAKDIFDALEAGKFADLVARFDAKMKESIPTAEKMSEMYASIKAQTGALKSLGTGETRDIPPVQVVIFASAFANGDFMCIVAFDAEGKIAGLGVRPKQ